MTENPNDPLTPPELFRRGIEITQEIRGRIEESQAYYLGRSLREPEQPLSKVFDPMRGPILRYFIATIRTITRTRFIERFCQSAAFHEFRQSSEATLEELRLLAVQLAMCLGVPGKTDRQRSVGQALKTSVYFFRIANGRFFRQLPWNGSLVHLLLKNRNNEGMGIYIADRLLNDIAKAFEVRERQLHGETAAPAHEFFISQFERIERKIESEHERTRQRIEETHGLIQKVLSVLGTILSSITAAARQIIKSINTRNIEGLDITGPRSPECRDQPTCNRTPAPTDRRINHHQTAATPRPSLPFSISSTNRGKSHHQKSIGEIVKPIRFYHRIYINAVVAPVRVMT